MQDTIFQLVNKYTVLMRKKLFLSLLRLSLDVNLHHTRSYPGGITLFYMLMHVGNTT